MSRCTQKYPQRLPVDVISLTSTELKRRVTTPQGILADGVIRFTSAANGMRY
jgi:hypothetical protein